MSDATLERVLVLSFLLRFPGGGPSVPLGLSSAIDDGDVNMNLKAWRKEVMTTAQLKSKYNATFTSKEPRKSPFSTSLISHVQWA
jgi:hypothetical protein